MTYEDYSEYDKKRLLEVVRIQEKQITELKKKKKYGLVWNEKKHKEDIESEAEEKIPVLKSVNTNDIQSDKSDSTNILIEGDNYHALSVLNYTHKKKVDMVYIDPPYNTGDTLMYNNNYVDADDPYIHSKFLSMLHKRLKLSKNILKKNGVICCTIDDYELMSVLGILDDLGARVLSIVVIVIKPEGRGQDEHIKGSHEYAIFATFGQNAISRKILPRTEIKQKYPETASDGRQYRWDTFYRRGDKKSNPERESRWYPIYVNEKTMKISATEKKGWKQVFPIDTNNTKWIWDMLFDDFKQFISNIDKNDPEIIAKQNPTTKQITIHIRRYKKYHTKPTSYWNHPDYSPQSYGSKLIPKIIGKDIKFDYPKSVFAVYDCIDVFLPENGIVLDFFAGSGTTGHATLLLNLRDEDIENTFIEKYGEDYHTNQDFLNSDAKLYSPFKTKQEKIESSFEEISKLWTKWRKNHAKRRFIICTNNEIPKKILDKLKKSEGWDTEKESSHSEGICRKITYPRMKGVARGYKWTKYQAKRLIHPVSSQGNITNSKSSLSDKVPKIPFRLKYFRTDFVDFSTSNQNKKKIVDKSTEMLCLKEDCFEQVKERKKFKIFKNNQNYLGIVYYFDGIKEFKKEVKKLAGGGVEKINTYVFSFVDEVDPEEFSDVSSIVDLKPIPSTILNTYRRIFRC